MAATKDVLKLISSNFNKSKTLYFSIDDNPELKKFYLYLNGSNEGIINNLIFLRNDKYPQGKIITSITIFKSLDLQQDVLAKKVIKELKLIFPDKINNHELIKIFYNAFNSWLIKSSIWTTC